MTSGLKHLNDRIDELERVLTQVLWLLDKQIKVDENSTIEMNVAINIIKKALEK